MKRLLDTPITRDRLYVGDWIPASAHDGAQGLADFMARMQKRIEACNKSRPTAQAKVRAIRK